MSKYLGLLIFVVAVFGIATFFYQFGTKKLPSDYVQIESTGVVYKKNPFTKSCAPYFLANIRTDTFQCQIYQDDGSLAYSIPFRYCHFLDRQRLFTYSNSNLSVIDPSGLQLWKKNVKLASDVDVSQKRQEIAMVAKNFKTIDGFDHRYDDVEIVDFAGKSIFKWSSYDNRTTLHEQMRLKDLPMHNKTGAVVIKISSVQIIPKNNLDQWHKAFSEGNVLINLPTFKMIAIISRELGKVVWQMAYAPGDVHSAKISESSPPRILWFRNYDLPLETKDISNVPAGRGYEMNNETGHLMKQSLDSESGEMKKHAVAYSSVEKLEPSTRKIKWIYDPQQPYLFFSPQFGSVYECDNGNVIVSHYTNGGAAMEINPQGEIVWEFINPFKDPMTKLPATIYDFAPVDPSAVENFRSLYKK